jgi:hypothetical protein
VIWSHNTTTSRTTQFSPFKLLYGEEAMLPEELCLGTWRDIPSSDEDLKASVKNIEEVRLQAATNLSSYQEETRRWKNKKIRPKFIRSGDLVLRKIPKGSLKGKMHGKWEGPFIASATSNEAAFKLRRLTGEECGHAAEVLRLRSLRSGNCCYFRFVVFVSVMLKKFVIYVH